MFSCVDEIKSVLSPEEGDTIDYLLTCGQENVLLSLPSIEALRAFLKDIVAFDKVYPGGLKFYVEKCRDLLTKSSQGANPFSGWTPSVPPIVNVEFNTQEFHELEKEGLEELTHSGFILIAGGLGERLGYNSIKVGLPIETFTNLPYLGFYIKKILSIQHRSKDPNCILPFAIMTSENNHDLTVEFLRNNNYFGMPESQITIMMQDCIPAVRNMKGEIATDAEGHIIKKPHGHGDIHFCLYRDHVIESWLEKYNINQLFFFQDTNTVNFHTMPCVAALRRRMNAHMVSTCVRRRPHEQTGGLCKLVNGDEEMICNVEYNQLEDVIKSTIDPRGDFADEEGYSPFEFEVCDDCSFPGNCNNLCLDIRDYYSVISQSSGIVPEFVNPKYKPGSKTEFTVPSRLESLMQDYPKLLLKVKKSVPVKDTCLVVTFPRFMAWSPVKNDYERAAILKQKTGFEESPRSGEADIQELFRKQLLSVNDCPICNKNQDRHIVIEEGCHICLWPEAGMTTEELHSHLGMNVVIKKGSVLIIKCRNWYLENVTVDGCMIVDGDDVNDDASVRICNCTVSNKGWRYVPIDKNDMSYDIVYRMRGYIVEREESLLIDMQSSGVFEVRDHVFNGNEKVILKSSV